MKTEKRKAHNQSIYSMNSFLKKVMTKMERGSTLYANLDPLGTLTLTTNSKVALDAFDQDFSNNEN